MTTILPGSVCANFRRILPGVSSSEKGKYNNCFVFRPFTKRYYEFCTSQQHNDGKNIYIQKSVMHLQSFCFVSLNIFNFCPSCCPCIMICLAVTINSREKWWKRGFIVLLVGPLIEDSSVDSFSCCPPRKFLVKCEIFVRNEGEEELKESK